MRPVLTLHAVNVFSGMGMELSGVEEPLKQVHLPGAAWDFFCQSPFSADSFTVSVYPHLQSNVLISWAHVTSLLAGHPQTIIKPLQEVQNSVAKLILKSGRAEHA